MLFLTRKEQKNKQTNKQTNNLTFKYIPVLSNAYMVQITHILHIQ